MRYRVPRLLVLLLLLAGFAPLWAGTGGPSTRLAAPPAAGELGGPIPGLGTGGEARWEHGRVLFDRDVPASDGLGAPDFNGDSCRACHQDPVVGGSAGLDLNVSRAGVDHGGAGPFEDLPEGQVLHRFRLPTVAGRREYDATVADVFEQRQAPPLFGLGLVEGIPASAILALEDPDDLDGDGIRGIARRVDVGSGIEVGRFGWKAGLPRVADFVRQALGEELGITALDDGRGFALTSDADGVLDPEASETDVGDLIFFLRNLAPPPRGGSTAPEVALGASRFEAIGCAACHRPTMPGAGGIDVPLFSDLLLHDVMPAAFRGMAEDGAGVGLYRTPPLWGIRHSAPYLHDGRAETLEAAILAHAGEGAAARAAYQALPPAERQAVLRFLEDL